ncbi:MAG: hypothetical protein J5I81_01415 [Nitrococcus mobilis]|nr:hypothetical protein [Nitrococcus mobilis]
MRIPFHVFYGSTNEAAAADRPAPAGWPQAAGGYVRWNWLPWKFLLRRAARAHGFLDPVALLARLQRFAQPSEVHEPLELLRAGVVFHARGLINARVIQHNLDWIWPYWIERQFDPGDPAFLPRAFSITHVNLTHRNWTALGVPSCPDLPIVDPRGLVTPFLDGWSLDAWVLGGDGAALYPSRVESSEQRLELGDGLTAITDSRCHGLRLLGELNVAYRDGVPTLQARYTGYAVGGGFLAVALRPYNPEGISFIHQVALTEARRGWLVEGRPVVQFGEPIERHSASDYRHGDVATRLAEQTDAASVDCDVGLASAAALFALPAGAPRRVEVSVPLVEHAQEAGTVQSWSDVLASCARLEIPETGHRFLYEAALRTLVLHTVNDVYPGPYTYKRFWFRDAAFIINALLAAGLFTRAERALSRFPQRQNPATGYFHSQEGEWDSNGQALWSLRRYRDLTGRALPESWLRSVRKGARWIVRKRLPEGRGELHDGLLPAGFSAEHLGPNDYYYWDDFWAVAGLRAAASLCEDSAEPADAARFSAEAEAVERAIARCLQRDEQRLGRPAMPASPYRRLDPGAVGSLAVGYPLQACPGDDRRLLGTVEYLLEKCMVNGGFFQDMVHSGINAYLTLHIAQVLLRAGDVRCVSLLDTVAALASRTGQWPEAIHPRTLGGCMGDGQHVWAAAEWIMMIRNGFVREEGERLVLAGGLPRRWLDSGERLAFGPAPTRFGTVRVSVGPTEKGRGIPVCWDAQWRRRPEAIVVAPLEGDAVVAAAEDTRVYLHWRSTA